MDGETVKLIATVVGGLLSGGLLKHWHARWEERQIERRQPEIPMPAPNGNGKYVGRELCDERVKFMASKIDTVILNQDRQVERTEKLADAIFGWKDEAMKTLGEHGERIATLEGRNNGRPRG